MQPHGREHMSQDKMHALRHVALTDVGLLGVVAKVGALEHSANDLAEDEDTGNRSIRKSAHEETLDVRLAAAIDPACKSRRIRRCHDPASMDGASHRFAATIFGPSRIVGSRR
jgi:hypothetical protein